MKTVMTMLILAASAVPAVAIAGYDGGAAPQTARGRLILYDQPGYNGQAIEIDRRTRVLRWGSHPRSIAIHPGDRWEICERAHFGECVRLSDSVADTEAIGIPAGRDIGSIRPAVDAVRAATPNMAPAQPQRQPGM